IALPPPSPTRRSSDLALLTLDLGTAPPATGSIERLALARTTRSRRARTLSGGGTAMMTAASIFRMPSASSAFFSLAQGGACARRSEEHTSELQSRVDF